MASGYFLIARVKSFYNYSFYNSVSACKTGKGWWNVVDQGLMESSWIGDKIIIENLDPFLPKEL